MVHYYLVVNEEGKVIGNRTSPKGGSVQGQVEVDEATYNQFSSLKPYESMTYDFSAKQFTKHDDPRPEIGVVLNKDLVKVGEAVLVHLTKNDSRQFIESKQVEEGEEVIVEYEAPDGRIGLVKANFIDGEADINLTPDKSGYYRIRENTNIKLSGNLVIPVYEK